MDYIQIIKEAEKRIRNKKALLFVHFLETLLEWIEILYKDKRLDPAKKKIIEQALPSTTLEAIQYIHPTEMSEEAYSTLKKALLKETKILFETITRVGDLRVHDFDLLQFNIAQIFGKEELASMVEWARIELEKNIQERQLKKEMRAEKRLEAQQEYLQKLQQMSQQEIVQLVTNTLFDFTPSARTEQERLAALKKTRQIMQKQKKKFRHFELTIAESVEEAQQESQTMVFKKIGDVKRDVYTSAQKFEEKAKFIVSAEGPKKQVKKAQSNILKGKREFSDDTEALKRRMDSAQKQINIRRKKFIIEREDAQETILATGQVQIEHGKHFAELAKQHMQEEEKDTEELFSTARNHLEQGRTILEKEKANLEVRKQQAEKILQASEDHLTVERTKLDTKVQAYEQHITSLQESLFIKRKEAVARAEEYTATIKDLELNIGKKRNLELNRGKKVPKIDKKHPIKVIDEKKIRNDLTIKMQRFEKSLEQKKDLLAYDVRFKQYALKQRALEQKETMTQKFEDFQERQKTLSARHRAHTKAKIIRALLHEIRAVR